MLAKLTGKQSGKEYATLEATPEGIVWQSNDFYLADLLNTNFRPNSYSVADGDPVAVAVSQAARKLETNYEYGDEYSPNTETTENEEEIIY